MKTIRNKTHGPLRVPLPRGKVLHLGPLKTGEIATQAADHPPLQKLVEAGQIEILGEGRQATPGQPTSAAAPVSSQGHHPDLQSHHRGER